jgi:hypothetical protein
VMDRKLSCPAVSQICAKLSAARMQQMHGGMAPAI